MSESALYYFTLEPSLRWFPSLSGRKSPCWSVTLTSADGGKVPHVLEEFADDGAGSGVQAVAVDPQVELDPAGLLAELHWGFRGREVQLLFVHLASSESVKSVSSVLGKENAKTCRSAASGCLHPFFCSFSKTMKHLICTRLDTSLDTVGGHSGHQTPCPQSAYNPVSETARQVHSATRTYTNT